jgi:hypothetical protein
MARTKITNNTGATRIFGFIPPHGVQLADGEDVTIDGDLRTILASGRGRYGRRTELSAFSEMEESGDILVEELAEPGSSSSSS